MAAVDRSVVRSNEKNKTNISFTLLEYVTYTSHLLTTLNGSVGVFIYFLKHRKYPTANRYGNIFSLKSMFMEKLKFVLHNPPLIKQDENHEYNENIKICLVTF